MPIEKFYEIGDRPFIQRPLVLGQVEQLLEALKGARFPLDSDNRAGMIIALADRLPAVMAVVLTPLGQKDELEAKDLAGIAGHLARTCDLKLATEVVEDFFALTPVFSIYERIAALMSKKSQTPSKVERAETLDKIPSSSSAPSSAPETSANGGA